MLSAYGDPPPATKPIADKRRAPPPKLRLVAAEEEARTSAKGPPKLRPGLY